MNKLISFLLPTIILLNACNENEKIVNPVNLDTTKPFGPHGDIIVFTYGECDDKGNFTSSKKDIKLHFREKMNVNGYECNMVELEDWKSTNKLTFFLTKTKNSIKLFTFNYFPLVRSNIFEEYSPRFWHTLWTSDFSKPTFDTMTYGEYPLLIPLYDSLPSLVFVKCLYRFEYKIENLGETLVSVPYYNTILKAYGTKITFNTIVKLTDNNYRFTKFDNIDSSFANLPSSEFYFDNNRSSYIDKVVMEVYYAEPIGIFSIWIKHRTLFITKNYKFIYDKRI